MGEAIRLAIGEWKAGDEPGLISARRHHGELIVNGGIKWPMISRSTTFERWPLTRA